MITEVKQHRTWSELKRVVAWESQVLESAVEIMDKGLELLIG